jgi:hypothetical protein
MAGLPFTSMSPEGNIGFRTFPCNFSVTYNPDTNSHLPVRLYQVVPLDHPHVILAVDSTLHTFINMLYTTGVIVNGSNIPELLRLIQYILSGDSLFDTPWGQTAITGASGHFAFIKFASNTRLLLMVPIATLSTLQRCLNGCPGIHRVIVAGFRSCLVHPQRVYVHNLVFAHWRRVAMRRNRPLTLYSLARSIPLYTVCPILR